MKHKKRLRKLEEELDFFKKIIQDGKIKLPCTQSPNRFLEITFDGEKAKTEIVEYAENRQVLALGETTIILTT